MSKVLVGFDFSAGSAYAVDLAIDLANRLKADIRLVYVKEKDQDEGPIREEIERRNAGVAHLLNGIKLEYVIREGKVSEELCEQAKEDEASYIIVGTHGMSGFEKNWIGRNTYRTMPPAWPRYLVPSCIFWGCIRPTISRLSISLTGMCAWSTTI